MRNFSIIVILLEMITRVVVEKGLGNVKKKYNHEATNSFMARHHERESPGNQRSKAHGLLREAVGLLQT
jgi:hypothetical protein